MAENLPSRSEIVRREKWAESWTLWAIPVSFVLSLLIYYAASQGIQDTWFAVGNLIIAAGYVFVTLNVAPYFAVDRDTKVAAALFFFTCAATHIELAAHCIFDADGLTLDDMTSWHMLFIHTLQPFAIWRFVLGLRKSAVIDRSKLVALEKTQAREDARNTP